MTGAYLAYAIDQARGFSDVVLWVKNWLEEEVDWIFDPGQAFTVRAGASPDPGIRAINAQALDRSDLVLAILPRGTVSVGVPMEIDRAVRAGKMVCVISDAPSWMLQFEEKNAAVFPSWGPAAREWVSEALRGISEGLTARAGASMPVVVSEGAEAPRRGYHDDAGLDLVVSEDRWIGPGEFVDIPCGVSVELPEGTWGMLTGRSSTLRKRGLLVSLAVIDTGYRGPLYAGAWNMTNTRVKVEAGDRVAQLVLLPNVTQGVEVVQVERLGDSDRGTAGFGSTGA